MLMSRSLRRLLPLAAALATGLAATTAAADNPDESATASDSVSKAIFAGGCFWCMEPPFDRQSGVIDVTSGYTGGDVDDPSYEAVSSGNTGHAEAVEVTYDAERISYDELLQVFWRNVDPFAENYQFCDHGNQYRAAIFYRNAHQRELAEASLADMRERLDQPLATGLEPADTFWDAEDYHQDYADKNPVRYKFYRFRCGRDDRLEAVWGDEAGGPTFD